jgi:hypothetical protein
MNALLEAALQLADARVPVVPAEGKNPGALLGADWNRQASCDPRRLRDWWARWPRANVGIVPARALVPIDVDDADRFRSFQREHGAAPPTPRYLTGGGPGRERLLFGHPGHELPRHLCPGVQVRDGALVSIAPPSRNPDSGELYEWTVGFDEVPLAPLPRRWLAAAAPVKRSRRDWCELARSDHHPSERHSSLLSLAGKLVPVVGVEATYELLCGWNGRRCKPPKPEAEVAEIVRWVAARELER